MFQPNNQFSKKQFGEIITKIISYLISLSIATSVMTACVFKDPTDYPIGWGGTIYIDDNNIHLLEGTYESTGLHAYRSSIEEGTRYTNLAYLLFENKPSKYLDDFDKDKQSDSVSLKIINDDIVIKAYKNRKLLKQRVLHGNQYSIKDGWLTIESIGASTVVVATEFEKEVYQISINNNGDLIFRNTASGFGLLLVLPMGGYGERWYRFKNVLNLSEKEPASIEAHRFVDNNDGTVADTKTGLMWTSTDSGKGLSKEEAEYYCEFHEIAGYSDWRMPTLRELEVLYIAGIRSYDISGDLIIKIHGKIHNSSLIGVYDFDIGSSNRDYRDGLDDNHARALPVRNN